MKQTKPLLYTGVIAALLFWICTVICGYVHGNYNHLNGTISELGALGTRSQTLFSNLILVISVLGICFFIGLVRACKEMGITIIPVLPIPFLCLSLAGIAIFPQGTDWHPIVGQLSLLIIPGPFLAILLWRKKGFLPIRLLSLVSLLFIGAALLLLLTEWAPPAFKQNYGGLIQRLFHAGWSIWFVALGICFMACRSPTVSSGRC